MITVHQYRMSPYNEKVTRMLNYKGIPYQIKWWTLTQRKQVTAFNPTGKLPAIEHNGKLVCDSTDIAWYLEDTFPESPLVPAEPALRAQVHVLEDWADESLYFYEMHLRFTTPGNQQRNIKRMLESESAFMRWLLAKLMPGGIRKITASQGIGRKTLPQLLTDTQRHINAVSDMVGDGKWLVDDQLSLADLAVYGMFQCFRDADMVRDQLEKYPNVTAWMARLEQATGSKAEK